MSAKTSGHVWDLDLPANKKFVLLAYTDHSDHLGNNMYPSIDLIAYKTGYSRRQAQRITDELVADGLLIPDGKGSKGTNKFKYGWDAGKKLQPFKGRIKGVKMTPVGGDILSIGGCQNDTIGGDIAMSPEPSLEPSMNLIASDDAQAPAAQDVKPVRKPHKYEPWHDALVLAFGINPTTLTSTADGLYWKVASELAKVNFPVERIGDLYRFVKQKQNREKWGDFTASALAKYAPSYLATLQPKPAAPAQQEWPAEWYPRTDDYLPLDAHGNWAGAK